MDFAIDEAQQDVRKLARQILEDLSTHERLVEVEASTDGVDRRLWEELGKSNLLGVAIPEAHGGSDMGFQTLCALVEEVGRTVAAVPAIPTLVTGALPIARFGSPAQRERWLPGVVSGATLLSAALLEAGSDDPTRPATRAEAADGGWRLSGRKVCVPIGQLAERVLVPATADDGTLRVFLVDPSGPGAATTPQQVTHREPQCELVLDGAPGEALGEPGDDVARWIAEHATAAYCALQVGVSERALEMTAAYTRERRQFDRPIGSFQAVHMRAADAFIDLEGMRLTAMQAVWRLDRGLPAEDAVAVAKYWAADGGQRLGYAAQHLHGGIGIDIDYPLHRYYLWAKAVELTLGSAPVQLERIGRRLAEEPVEFEAS